MWWILMLCLFGAHGLSWEEWTTNMAMKVAFPEVIFEKPIEYNGLPMSVDWRGKTGPVRNQGPCGSCWAHAGIGAIESAWRISGRESLALSIEEIVSCVGSERGYDSLGCEGGYSPEVFDWVQKRGDVIEALWPYDLQVDPCNDTIVNKTLLKSKGEWVSVQAGNEAALMAAVALRPVVIYFDVTQDFVAFWSGVFKPYTCGRRVDHAMLVVGYAVNTTLGSYWIVQNSWGSDWTADGGFVKIAMTGNGAGPCGMYQYMYQPSGDFVELEEYKISVKLVKTHESGYINNVLCKRLIEGLGAFNISTHIVRGCVVEKTRRNYGVVFSTFMESGDIKRLFTLGNKEFTRAAGLLCGSIYSVSVGVSMKAAVETCLKPLS